MSAVLHPAASFLTQLPAAACRWASERLLHAPSRLTSARASSSLLTQLPAPACRYIPERLLHAYGTPRPIFMVLLGLLSATVMAFNAYATLGELLPASILAGFAFGAHWSVMATLTSELFGLNSFASNYCLIQVRQGGFL